MATPARAPRKTSSSPNTVFMTPIATATVAPSPRASHTLAGSVDSTPRFDKGSTARTLSFDSSGYFGESRADARREIAKAHAVRLAQTYGKRGSAAYRSTSDRFGCSADFSMQGYKANENQKMSDGHTPPPIGSYVRAPPHTLATPCAPLN